MIEFHGVHKVYRVASREIPALQPTRLNTRAGRIFGLIGHSGADKNALLCLINRLEESSGGHTLVEGEDVTILDAEGLRRFYQHVGMIFQHFSLLFSKTVADNIAMPLYLAGGFGRAEADTRVSELLARVGLSDYARRYPAQLSGGQKQRIGIARVLICRPSILLCDEATSALDPQTTASVLQLLAEINHELKLTIVLIACEIDMIRRVRDQVAVTDGDAIVEQGDTADVFLHPQRPTIRRFVLEAERVDEDERHNDFTHVPGFILRLTFHNETTYALLPGTVARQTGVDYSTLSGRIGHTKDTPYDRLTPALASGDLGTAMSQLSIADVHMEVLR